MIKKLTKILLSILTIVFLFTIPGLVSAQFAGPSLFRGDFVTVHNVTEDNPPAGWANAVDAAPGNIIEIRVVARNEGEMTANHVQVIGHVPENLGTTHVFSATLQAPYGGGTQITDTGTVTIRGGSNQTFRYEPGHTRLFGVTNLFNCPSGCENLPGFDNVASTGFEIGDIGPHQSVQVTFKARMTNLVTPTPTISLTPTPTITVTPTVTITPTRTPTPSITVTPTVPVTPTPTAAQVVPPNVQCPNGFNQSSITQIGSDWMITCQSQSQSQSIGPITITVSGNNNNDNDNNNNNDSNSSSNSTSNSNPIINVSTPVVRAAAAPIQGEVKGIQQLPKTGLPLAAWALSGLLPVGALVRRFGKGEQKTEETPYHLWQEREFSK